MVARYGWYGDDFTGATDTLACLAEAGQRAMLFPRLPTPAQLAAAGPLDAIGIAGATRAMAPAAMRAELDPAGRFFAERGVRVLHYKCCSTFDSAPGIGSIGAAVAALRPYFPDGPLPIFGGQPSIARYCLFSHLFAAAGSGGAVHRLDRHPTMSAHPVTPMAESDLRAHLAAQGLSGVTALHYPTYEKGGGVVAAALHDLAGAPAVLLDVARADDLALLGPLLWNAAETAPLLAVGPSSVAQALAHAWPHSISAERAKLPPAEGPVFVLVGSLSPISRAQADAAASYAQLEITAEAMIDDAAERARIMMRALQLLRAGRSVMLRIAHPGVAQIPTGQSDSLARASAEFVATLLRGKPLRRVGIAGGDTSSRVVLALDVWALTHRRTLAPGVALCAVRSDEASLDGTEVLLKGGQMGPLDLFEALLHGM